MSPSVIVGVLALQGDFEKHTTSLAAVGATARLVRNEAELAECRGLIIPGGESTTLVKLLHATDLIKAIPEYARTRPVMGTCAGMILASMRVTNHPIETLHLIDADVERNAYGRQVDSFIDTVHIPALGKNPVFEGVFIRAPRIVRLGEGCEPLGFHKEQIVLARNHNILIASFHPELTADNRIHRYFIHEFKLIKSK